jgi:hypothetical protein
MQVLIGLSMAGEALVQVGLGCDLIQHAIRVGDASETQRKRADPNRVRGGNVTSVNSLQQALPPSLKVQGGWVGRSHRSSTVEISFDFCPRAR